MKHYIPVLLCVGLLFTGCGDTSAMENLIESQQQETAVVHAEQTTSPSTMKSETIQSTETQASETQVSAARVSGYSAFPMPESNIHEADIDFTLLDGNMLYAQCSDMAYSPEKYEGKSVRIYGTFGYYQDEKTGKEYFAVVLQDATACCSQNMEFVLKGEHTFPDDYPELGSIIVVFGDFEPYEENGTTYIQLVNAEIERVL